MPITDRRYPDMDAQVWRSRFTTDTWSWAPPPPGPQLGPVIYTPSVIANWSDVHAEYTRLAASSGGNNSRSITDHGTSITSSTARDQLRDDAVYAKCQAVLWAADGSSTRHDKAVEVLDGCKDIRTYLTSEVQQDRLVAGWFATNLCQAAWILGYDDADFVEFLTDIIYPLLDARAGGNWFASFSDSRLAIASFAQRMDLWIDAMDFFDFRIRQTLHHPDYDGGSIVPLRNSDWPATKTAATSTSRTSDHWWDTVTAAPWTASFEGWDFVAGTDCEFHRDLGHEVMGMVAWLHAAHTIHAVGDTIPQHAWDRLTANVAFLAERALYREQNGVSLHPAGTTTTTGRIGWYVAKRLLRDLATADVDALLLEPGVYDNSASGANANAAEHFADGSLL